MTLLALGVYAATTAGYFKLAHAYLPRKEVLFQGSAIASSGLIQLNLVAIQGMAVKRVERNKAQRLLNYSTLILIGGAGVIGGVPWKVNIITTLFFSIIHLGIAKYVVHTTYFAPKIREAKELIAKFKKDPILNFHCLEEVNQMRREAVFICVALFLKMEYCKGVICFCKNLPEDRNVAKKRYLALDPTIYRPSVFSDQCSTYMDYPNSLVVGLISAAAELGVEQPWPDKFDSQLVDTRKLICSLSLSLNPKVAPVLQQLGADSYWNSSYYRYIRETQGEKEARAYLENMKEKGRIPILWANQLLGSSC